MTTHRSKHHGCCCGRLELADADQAQMRFPHPKPHGVIATVERKYV